MNRAQILSKPTLSPHESKDWLSSHSMSAGVYRVTRRVLEIVTHSIRLSAQHLSLWRVRSRQRRLLAEMSPHMLRDIGLSRYEVLKEYEKPFWRE